jgi:hypothetical protein
MSRPRLLEIVSLARDIPAHGLKAGAEGTVLGLYEPDGLEVEFLDALGEHIAVLTLEDSDIRSATDGGPTASPRPHPSR